MAQVLISFPPGAGGNHLRNLLMLDKIDIDKLYSSRTVHNQPGHNFNIDQVYDSDGQFKDCIVLGHFGEVMSYREKIKTWPNRKFILISPETLADRELLYSRWKKLGPPYVAFESDDEARRRHNHNSYYDGEQVFLYEASMFRDCFATDMSNIMNIPISEWFTLDISLVLDRISKFLNTELDNEKCLALHKIWCHNNLDIEK
jgi:hypothetical protein